MNNIILQKTWVQGRPVAVDNLLGTAFTGEAEAHTFIIKGVDAADQTVPISGDITGKLLASNNVTVPLTGTIENGCAVVTLTEDCYYVPGKFIFSVYSTDGDTTICLYCAVGNIFRTASDIIEYPSAAIPDVAQLIEDLQYAIDSFPSDLSGLLMAIAPSFNKNTAYSAGDYVWYYGGFYKFTVDHPAGNWNPGHVVDVHLADDVADLSGAVDGIDTTIGNTPMGTTATTITGAVKEINDAQGDLKSALSAVEDLENVTGKHFLTSWSIGRAQAGENNTGITYGCYSDILPVDSTPYYFDTTKYKVALAWFNTNTQDYADALGSWITTSPFVPSNSRPYMKINVQLLAGSGNIDTTDVSASTYYYEDATPDIVYAVRQTGCCFVNGSTGADTNTGESDSPFLTLQKAIDSGYGTIFATPGEYAPISIIDKTYPVKIMVRGSGTGDKIKIVSSSAQFGVTVNNCSAIEFDGVWVYNPQRYGFYIRNSQQISMNDCIADNNQTENFSLFYFENCDVILNNCVAHDSTLDGFNFHGTGSCLMHNCLAYDNGDDGISHHDSWTGSIYGGEYYGNGKGGIVPYSGANIKIYGAYCHDNTQYGIYFGSSADASRSKGIISGCACVDNTRADICVYYSDVVGFNNVYGTKTIGTDGVFTELTNP